MKMFAFTRSKSRFFFMPFVHAPLGLFLTDILLHSHRYIYTDEINLNSFELVCDICYAAKKYMLPALVEECTKYLWRDLYPKNACRAFEFARLFEEPILMEKSIQVNVIIKAAYEMRL